MRNLYKNGKCIKTLVEETCRNENILDTGENRDTILKRI